MGVKEYERFSQQSSTAVKAMKMGKGWEKLVKEMNYIQKKFESSCEINT